MWKRACRLIFSLRHTYILSHYYTIDLMILKKRLRIQKGIRREYYASTNVRLRELSTDARHEGFMRVAVMVARVNLFSGWAVRKRGHCSGVLASTSTWTWVWRSRGRFRQRWPMPRRYPRQTVSWNVCTWFSHPSARNPPLLPSYNRETFVSEVKVTANKRIKIRKIHVINPRKTYPLEDCGWVILDLYFIR